MPPDGSIGPVRVASWNNHLIAPEPPPEDARPPTEIDTVAVGPDTVERRRIHAGRHLKRTAGLVVFLLVFNNLVVPQIGGARKAAHLLSEVNPFLLVLALALELAAFAAYTELTRAALPCETQERVDRLSLLRIQLSTKAVTNLVPGGSAAGGALGFRLMTAAGIEGSSAGFALATVGLGSAVVLNILLWLGLLVSIPLYGFNPAYATAAIVGVVLLGAFASIVVLLMRGQQQAERVVRAVARHLPFVTEDGAARVVGQIATRLGDLVANPALVRRCIGWALANWLLDAASLWVFIRAFGSSVGVVKLIVAFGLANVLAAIPITPGGLGVIEAVLTSSLVGFGLDRGTAAISVITYRVAAFWLPIPLGAIAYGSLKLGPGSLVRRRRHAIRRLTEDAAVEAETHAWTLDEPAPDPRS